MSAKPVLQVEDLAKEYASKRDLRTGKRRKTLAVAGVSFSIAERETFGLIGESGSGKSTTAKLVTRLLTPSSGRVLFRGEDVTEISGDDLLDYRTAVQLVFQDPSSSLNPRRTVVKQITEGLDIRRRGSPEEREARAIELMRLVQLPADDRVKLPNAFSGGQRQRIAIARALAVEPDFLVLDEPVSALDVSIRAGILRLLNDLQDELGLAYLFIAHDLALVRQFCDTIAVMYQGHIVETGSQSDIYEKTTHPYTGALLSAVPIPDPRVEASRVRTPIPFDVLQYQKGRTCRFFATAPALDGETCHPERGVEMHTLSETHLVSCAYA